ncbi:hypothetical protein [Chryseobacterium sp. RR2-3-20]|uniref:hypothetical protein n=1 Tax=Chryseobacterium sp. RR2-3-20 TaxID=2787626 RepID=UPI001ADEF114|nr:hypothetical protein [Chryseobacterium sp. RR2-3-20]
MEKKILKQLKTEYESREIKPSVDLWDQIEGVLEKESETVQKPLFKWWKYAAVIVFLISVSGILYVLQEHSSPVSEVKNIVDNSKKTEQKSNIITVESSTEKRVVNHSPSENQIKIKDNFPYTESKKSSEIVINNNINFHSQDNNVIDNKLIAEVKNEIVIPKSSVAKNKKVSYITADDLLLGRELDKTREENSNDQRRFGVIDMSKIKGPNSLKIFGITVYSDSLNNK